MFGQNPANISGCSLWLKDNKSKIDLKELENPDILNFNTSAVISEKERIVIDRNKLKPTFTMFLVYKSTEQEERALLKYSVGNQNILITNQKVKNSSGIEYSKYKSNQGVLLEYSANLIAIKNSNLCALSFAENKKEKTNIFEFIFYPRTLNPTEKLKIESYLSIKYGISLVGEKNYLNSSNAKIWNKENNKGFNHNITGIARDDKSDLFQKESENSIKNGLYIGFGAYDSINKYNAKYFENDSYLLWGDNGKNSSINFDKTKDEPINKMDRLWKIQKTNPISRKKLCSFILFDKSVFFQNKEKNESNNSNIKTLWLLVSPNNSETFNYSEAVYYPSKIISNDLLLFENITWGNADKNSDNFTFVEAPNLFMTQELLDSNCAQSQSAKIKLKIIGGKAPFLLKIEQNGMITNLEKSNRDFEIEALEATNYNFTLTDSNKQICTQNITTESTDGLNINVAHNWYLNANSEVEVVTSLKTTDFKNIKISWLKDGVVISTDKTLKAYEQGSYSLFVKNDKGCSKNIPFNISNPTTNNPEIQLYPNPVKSGEPFTLRFDLKQTSDIQIEIYNINGELLKHQNINKISSFIYSDTLQVSGNYLVVVTTETSSMTYKLIIN